MTITEGELKFFDLIKTECKIIFDIGCQRDIHYIEAYPQGTFYLFEPNPIFVRDLKEKVKDLKSNIIINEFGLGKETAKIKYYPDSQSFIKRTVDFQSNENLAIDLYIKDFKEYIEENNINFIDFLKIDTEGNDPDILFENIEYIKNHVKFVQFEYASTWLDRQDKYDIYDVYECFKNQFLLFLLYNKDHPLFLKVPATVIPISCEKDLDIIQEYMKNSYGFEIAMVNKKYDNM
jgi:FkbM family methyltransferase